MAKFPTYEEMGKKVAEEALNKYFYNGKTLREWLDILGQIRWIPVSERLPMEDDRYLTYIINQYDNRLQYIMISDFKKNINEWFPDDVCASGNVVAWMPLLVKPYKSKKVRWSDA